MLRLSYSLVCFAIVASEILDEDFHNYYLYTNRLREGIKLSNLNLDIVHPAYPTKIIMADSKTSHLANWIQHIINAYLEKGEFNLIVAELSLPEELEPELAGNNTYLNAYSASFVVTLVQTLKEENSVSLKDVHIIGFSYGAFAASWAGQMLRNYYGTNISRITGLDPMTPDHWSFEFSANAADVIDVVRTNSSANDLAHVERVFDFYANGGNGSQPGCATEVEGFVGCSHLRAGFLFAEAIENPRGFVATKCGSWRDYEVQLCEGNALVAMGSELKGVQAGKYYFHTRSKYPYSLT